MESNLKYRILGALVTVLCLAVTLPVFLDRSRHLEPVASNVPPMPDIPAWAKTTNEAQVLDDAQQLVSGEAERALLPDDPTVVKTDDPAPSQIPKDQSGLDAHNVPYAWVVQLGAFADLKNANQLRDNLRAKHYKAFTEHFPKEGLTRVYVGPELTREKIELLQKKLASELKMPNAPIKQWHPSR